MSDITIVVKSLYIVSGLGLMYGKSCFIVLRENGLF